MSFDSLDSLSISVVVIGYNIEKYIERCLISVFNQTYPNYEVIYVDDGSVDSSVLIAQKFENSDIDYRIIKKNNGGIISARKEGVNASKGQYVVFVDGDDEITSNSLSDFANSIKNAENSYDIIVSDYYEGRPYGKWIIRKNPLQYGDVYYENFVKGILDGSIYHYMFAKMYRRSFLLENKYLSFPDITIAEDLLTNSILGICNPSVLYVDFSSYKYHYNDTSVTRDGKNVIVDKQIETLNLMKEIIVQEKGYKYITYLDFQWYLFCLGYIQTSFSHGFKKYLIYKCRPFLKNIKKNNLYVNQKKDLGVIYGRSLIFVYMYLPAFACLFNFSTKLFIKILKKINILKV